MTTPPPPPPKTQNSPPWFEMMLDSICVLGAAYIVYLASSGASEQKNISSPFPFLSVYLILMASIIIFRLLMKLTQYKGDYDFVDISVMSTMFIGPCIVASAYLFSTDKDVRAAISNVGTILLGVGAGAMANNTKKAVIGRRDKS